MTPLTILYVGQRHDYGRPERGPSFEYHNLYDSLVNMDGGAHRVVEFPLDLRLAELGRPGMNAALVGAAREAKAHLLFAVMFADELEGAALRTVSAGGCATMAWFNDDHWRFPTYSRFQAPHFDWTVTTAHAAVPEYHRMGYRNVILSQFACNHFRYQPAPGAEPAGVSFVGQPHGDRVALVRRLEAAGMPVACFGQGWPAGPLPLEAMIATFTRSRINLNFSRMSAAVGWKDLARLAVDRGPDGRVRPRGPRGAWRYAREWVARRRRQIKARNFEIPGCGGFQLTGDAPRLTDYYRDGAEIAVFRTPREMVDRARYYLAHEEERARVAEAGYRRTLAEHTYEHRFRAIFRAAGLAPA